MTKYEHYIFDLYGTLADIHTNEESSSLWADMAAYYRQWGASYRPSELQSAYRRLTAEAEAAAGGAVLRQDAHEAHPEIRLEEVVQKLFQEKGINADIAQSIRAGRRFRKLSTEYIRLYDGAKELLLDIRKLGGKIWLLSNAQSIFTTWELDQLDLTACFDGVYLSSDYGVKKPDRRFYDILLRERGIAPDRAVMTGNDGLCDIEGSREAGLATLYIRSNLSPDEPTPPADYILEQMDLKQAKRILLGA